MKLINVIDNEYADQIDKYVNLKIEDILQITNGSVDKIMCTILDSHPFQQRKKIVAVLLDKIKNNGEIVLKFLDPIKLCELYINDKISSESLSNVIDGIKSVNNLSDIENIISTKLSFFVSKKYYDNNHIFMTIRKKL